MATLRKKTKTHSRVPKVPKSKEKVSVLRLTCTNCGEEEERVVYCSQCDAPMEVSEVKKKDQEEVEADETLTNAAENGDDEEDADEVTNIDEIIGRDSEDVDGLISSGGLSDIFGGGEAGGAFDDSDGDDLDLTDIVSRLDDE